MEAILGADQTIDSLVNDILDHYENYRENILTGKAMIVAYSRPIAMKIYKRILELCRPSAKLCWHILLFMGFSLCNYHINYIKKWNKS